MKQTPVRSFESELNLSYSLMKALDIEFFKIIVKNDPFLCVFIIVSDRDNDRFSKIYFV